MAIDLKTILDPAVLRKIWKDIRERERKVHLKDIPLVRDATSGIAFEVSLFEAFTNLRGRISDGTYRPHSPILIEAAKSTLLRRRLSFFAFEDALILGALVQAARPSLLKNIPEWVSFGRAQASREGMSISIDYEGWWTIWLRYMKLLKVIEGNLSPLLIVSDITNFFGSIDLSLMRSKISGATSLDKQANDLLFYMLENLRPTSEKYSFSGSFGLPATADDTARILANFYLADLDSELRTEGEQGRYTRWVDDIVVSVADPIEGGQVMARIEGVLANLGLVANARKTVLVSKEKFREDHFVRENEYLEDVHNAIESGAQLTSEYLRQFEDRLQQFLASPHAGQWNRILRRYYTEARRLRSKILLEEWEAHLADYPSDGRYILDYVSFFQGDLKFCERLFAYLREKRPQFDDIHILLYETLLLKPFPGDSKLKDYVVNQVECHFLGKDGFEPSIGYVKGLQALAMYKFGGPSASDRLAPLFSSAAAESPLFATYGLPIVSAVPCQLQLALEATELIDDSRVQRIRVLISRLARGDERATRVLLNLLQPKNTNYPVRRVIDPRALPLLRIALSSKNQQSLRRIHDARKKCAAKLTAMDDIALIDWVALDHLRP